jgi:hypothetical protein
MFMDFIQDGYFCGCGQPIPNWPNELGMIHPDAILAQNTPEE